MTSDDQDTNQTTSLLRCPRCDTELTLGTANVRGDAISLFVSGNARQHLYFDFVDGGTKKKRVIMRSKVSCQAYYCPKCHLFTVDNGKPEYG